MQAALSQRAQPAGKRRGAGRGSIVRSGRPQCGGQRGAAAVGPPRSRHPALTHCPPPLPCRHGLGGQQPGSAAACVGGASERPRRPAGEGQPPRWPAGLSCLAAVPAASTAWGGRSRNRGHRQGRTIAGPVSAAAAAAAAATAAVRASSRAPALLIDAGHCPPVHAGGSAHPGGGAGGQGAEDHGQHQRCHRLQLHRHDAGEGHLLLPALPAAAAAAAAACCCPSPARLLNFITNSLRPTCCPQTVLGIILGGGAGSRLYPLTKKRAKPAVPLGANYRLIDIPVSNCINSGGCTAAEVAACCERRAAKLERRGCSVAGGRRLRRCAAAALPRAPPSTSLLHPPPCRRREQDLLPHAVQLRLAQPPPVLRLQLQRAAGFRLGERGGGRRRRGQEQGRSGSTGSVPQGRQQQQQQAGSGRSESRRRLRRGHRSGQMEPRGGLAMHRTCAHALSPAFLSAGGRLQLSRLCGGAGRQPDHHHQGVVPGGCCPGVLAGAGGCLWVPPLRRCCTQLRPASAAAAAATAGTPRLQLLQPPRRACP